MLALPGAQSNFLYTWNLTLYENQGWLRGAPQHDGDISGLFAGLRRAGVATVAVDAADDQDIDFNMLGMTPLAWMNNLTMEATPTQRPDGVYLFLHTLRPGDPAPCQRLNDGLGVYVVRGKVADLNTDTLRSASNPAQQYSFICPGRATIAWPERTRD